MQALVYDEEYLCYDGDDYIGTATFTDDPFIGDSFLIMVVHKDRGIEEIALMPDNWFLKTDHDW